MNFELSPVDQSSKWIFGSVHVLPIWSHIAKIPVDETFKTIEVADELGISRSIVTPCIGRLAAIHLVEPVSIMKPGRPNVWSREDSPLWLPLRQLMDELENSEIQSVRTDL